MPGKFKRNHRKNHPLNSYDAQNAATPSEKTHNLKMETPQLYNLLATHCPMVKYDVLDVNQKELS